MYVLVGLVTTSSLVISHSAGAEVPDLDSTMYVMLLNAQCDWEFRDQFDYYMRLNNTQYERHIGDFQVLCLGGVKNLNEVEMYTVPNLRNSLPDAKFVFVYPESMAEQYHDYIEERYGHQYRYLALGNAEVSDGIAYVNEVPANIKHEMAHLVTCGTWHDEQGHDLDKIVKHPESDRLPWCLD